MRVTDGQMGKIAVAYTRIQPYAVARKNITYSRLETMQKSALSTFDGLSTTLYHAHTYKDWIHLLTCFHMF